MTWQLFLEKFESLIDRNTVGLNLRIGEVVK